MFRLLNAFLFAWKVWPPLIRTLLFLKPNTSYISIFGSARFQEDSEHYEIGKKIAFELGKCGYHIITGGGPGLMQAANEGAKSAGALSIGYNIFLPFEQYINPYVTKSGSTKYFFLRKLVLINYSKAFIILPGGSGTMDEFFETLTLMQTKKIQSRPIYIYNTTYHKHLLAYLDFLHQTGAMSNLNEIPVIATDDYTFIIKAIRQLSRN